MIRIATRKNSITITGHANFSSFGNDIVCAGVSALVGAFILSAKDEIAYTDNGDAVSIKVKGESEQLKGKIDMLMTGLEDIARDYPKYVVIDQAFMSKKDMKRPCGTDLPI